MSGRPDPAVDRWPDTAGEGGDDLPTGGRMAEEPALEGPGPVPAAGDAAARGGPVADGTPILADVAALTAERDEYLQALQRLKADFDNYRKRVVRQQEEQAARAAADLVAKLLPVLDNLDLAWAHLGIGAGAANGAGTLSEEARALAQSRTQLLDVLGREGLERVDAVEVPFDPTIHDAVAHSPAPAATPQPSAAVPRGRQPSGPSSGAPDEARGGTPPAAPGTQAAGPAGTEAAGGASREADGHQVVVEEVMRAGYRWRGQVLRPAMVRVRG